VKREASFPDQRGASQFGVIALVGARDTDAHTLCVEKHVIGWRRIVRIENEFTLKDTVLGRVRAGVVRIGPPPNITPFRRTTTPPGGQSTPSNPFTLTE
jgi:hypothetical protein